MTSEEVSFTLILVVLAVAVGVVLCASGSFAWVVTVVDVVDVTNLVLFERATLTSGTAFGFVVDLEKLECGCMLGRDVAADISRTSSVIDIEAFGVLVVVVLLFVLLWLSCLTPSAEAVDVAFASIEDVLLLADTVVVSLPAPVVGCPVACCLSVLSVLGTSPSL